MSKVHSGYRVQKLYGETSVCTCNYNYQKISLSFEIYLSLEFVDNITFSLHHISSLASKNDGK